MSKLVKPDQAVNESKWQRAVKEITDLNKLRAVTKEPLIEVNEENVKAIYLRLLGLWIGEPETVEGVPEYAVAHILEKIEENEGVKGKAKKVK